LYGPPAWSVLRRRGKRGKNRCGRQQQLCGDPPTDADITSTITTTTTLQLPTPTPRGSRRTFSKGPARGPRSPPLYGATDQSRRPFADA